MVFSSERFTAADARQSGPEGRPPKGFPEGFPGGQGNHARPGPTGTLHGGPPLMPPGAPPSAPQDGIAQGPGGPPGEGRGHLRPGGAGGRRPPVRILVIIAGVLVVAVAGGLLIGNLFSGDGGKEAKPADKNAVTVSDAARRLSVTVPKEWPKGVEETWSPSVVGLADQGPRPVLRATPDVVRFRTDKENVPGVFIGLTTDVTEGSLPPPSASLHPSACPTKSPPEQYRRGTLSGTITRWTGCNGGNTSITEVGLRDSGGKFGLWIRIKQVDGTDRTKQILDSVTATGP